MDSSRPFFCLLMLIVLNSLDVLCFSTSCGSNAVKCGNGVGCVSHSTVCDGNDNCDDGSDEVSSLCADWHISSSCGRGNVDADTSNYRTTCKSLETYCNHGPYVYDYDNYYDSSQDSTTTRTCEIVKSKQLPRNPVVKRPVVKRSVLSSAHVKVLSDAVNSTLNHQNCPMLYIQLGNHCIAFYSMAQVPWPEARQFCQSIYGDLISFDDIQMYANVHKYMKAMQLTTDYWLGGRYSMDNNGWTWLDDSTMQQGSPYWAERYSSSCVPRALPSNDPFSGPAEPLPGAPCYNYLQAPKERSLGYCAAITYQHFYYVTDEECTSQRSPLCILNTEHRTNKSQQNVDA